MMQDKEVIMAVLSLVGTVVLAAKEVVIAKCNSR